MDIDAASERRQLTGKAMCPWWNEEHEYAQDGMENGVFGGREGRRRWERLTGSFFSWSRRIAECLKPSAGLVGLAQDLSATARVVHRIWFDATQDCPSPTDYC